MNGLKKIERFFKGDKMIWTIAILLPLFSSIFVYSGLTSGQPIYKHLLLFIFYIGFMIVIHAVPYEYFINRKIITSSMVIVAGMLLYLLWQAKIAGGTNDSRFIRLLGFSIQPSSCAMILIMLHTVEFLCRLRDNPITSKENFRFWFPIIFLLLLIFPANLSTAVLIFIAVVLVLFVGGYPVTKLFLAVMILILLGVCFIGLSKFFPDLLPNRLDTWISRFSGENNFQIKSAKIAIYEGGWFGNGIGSGMQKYFLPQRTSDFIFTLIIEEAGVVIGALVLFVYFFLSFRFFRAIIKSESIKEKLTIIAMGLPILLYAFIHIIVAVDVSPVVTGQNLPLVSSGGTSLFCTGFSLAIILHITENQKKRARQKKTSEKIDDQ